jgi:hypothetical protein
MAQFVFLRELVITVVIARFTGFTLRIGFGQLIAACVVERLTGDTHHYHVNKESYAQQRRQRGASLL